MTRFPPDKLLRASRFWMLAGFLILVGALGGGSRDDIQSLVILRPLAAIFLGFALFFLSREQLWATRSLFMMLGAAALLIAIQLIPLPPMLWQKLPGRGIVIEVDQAAGLGAIWRPISLVPYRTWNALYSLLVPAAVLALCAGLSRNQRFAILPVLILITLFSGILGLLQVIGPPEGPLYLYRITNNGFAVGLFANRNHQAVLLACLFPMLAVYASIGVRTLSPVQARMRLLLCVGAGILFVPLIVVTGSRLGLILALLSLGSTACLYKPRRTGRGKGGAASWFKAHPFALGGLAVVALVGTTLLMSRGFAIERIVSADIGADTRVPLWQTSVRMIVKYFPFGSGYGSFPEVYQIDEPDWALSPSYGNHAHNELLEIMLTGGVLGIALVVAAIAAWAFASWRVFRMPVDDISDYLFGRLGSVLILILGVASIPDYPIRTPFLASVLTIAAVWLTQARAGSMRRT